MTENYPNSSNQNNPSGIWQHIWVSLKMQALEEIHQKRYLDAWETLKLLKDELPPECQEECTEECNKIETILKQSTGGYKTSNAQEIRISYLFTNLPEPIHSLMRKMTTSLFKHGWINKSFGAKPKFEGGGTL